MKYKILILILFFYFFILFQNSFLSRFGALGALPNFLLIFTCLLGFFENPHRCSGAFSVLAAGFFLDVFSGLFFGASIFSLLFVYFLIKELIHFLRDIPQKYSVVYFIPIFISCIIFYDLFFGLFSFFSGSGLSFPRAYLLLIEIISNLIIAIIGFYSFKKYSALKHDAKRI